MSNLSTCNDCGGKVVHQRDYPSQPPEYDVCPVCSEHTCCGRTNPVLMDDTGLYCETCYDVYFDQTSVEYNPLIMKTIGGSARTNDLADEEQSRDE